MYPAFLKWLITFRRQMCSSIAIFKIICLIILNSLYDYGPVFPNHWTISDFCDSHFHSNLKVDLRWWDYYLKSKIFGNLFEILNSKLNQILFIWIIKNFEFYVISENLYLKYKNFSKIIFEEIINRYIIVRQNSWNCSMSGIKNRISHIILNRLKNCTFLTLVIQNL